MLSRRAWQTTRQRSAWRAQQITGVLQSEAPDFPFLERECFSATLANCKTYIEYGSGGSTLAAVRKVPIVLSVENDRAFYRAVAHKARLLAMGQYFPIFVNTGWTKEWGVPVFQGQNALRSRLWRRYP